MILTIRIAALEMYHCMITSLKSFKSTLFLFTVIPFRVKQIIKQGMLSGHAQSSLE